MQKAPPEIRRALGRVILELKIDTWTLSVVATAIQLTKIPWLLIMTQHPLKAFVEGWRSEKYTRHADKCMRVVVGNHIRRRPLPKKIIRFILTRSGMLPPGMKLEVREGSKVIG